MIRQPQWRVSSLRIFPDITLMSLLFRRMFPTVRASVSGLEPAQHYFVLLDIVLAEESRYKYSGKQWTVAGKAEPQLRPR